MHNPLTPEREDVFWPAMRPREEATGRLTTGPEGELIGEGGDAAPAQHVSKLT